MKLRYSSRALRDLADYVTARSPKGALVVERRIRKTIDLIAAFPAQAVGSISGPPCG